MMGYLLFIPLIPPPPSSTLFPYTTLFRSLFIDYLLHALDVSAGTLSSVAKQYYGNTWSASGSVRAWTWCRENVALEENNQIGRASCRERAKVTDPIRTAKLSVLGRE